MNSWSSEQDGILINFVRNHDLLYNIKSKDHRKTQLKQKLWCEIGKTLKKTDADCVKRWHYVRDYYIRRKVKPGTGSSGEAARKRSDRLSFLDQLPSQRNRLNVTEYENTKNQREVIENPEYNIEGTQFQYQATRDNMYDEINKSNTEDSNNCDDTNVSKEDCNQRDVKRKTFSSHSQEHLNLRQTVQQVQNEFDETDLFFQSMAKIVKKLPRYEQAHLRMQIGSLVGNAELSYISSNLSRSSGPSNFSDAMPSPSASGIPECVVPSPTDVDVKYEIV